MFDGTTTAGRLLPADPARDRQADTAAAPAAVPGRVARLLVLIRWIISYGTDLASTIHQRAASPDFPGFARRYRRGDLATIIARIRRGLLLAAGLETRLAERAAKGHDIPEARLPTASAKREQGSAAPGKRRAAPRTNIIDLPLDRLPTAEEIAEELRRRPVGAVLVDICRDLGIRQGDLPSELWRTLQEWLTGGQFVALLNKETNDWLWDELTATGPDPASLLGPSYRPTVPAACTGPP